MLAQPDADLRQGEVDKQDNDKQRRVADCRDINADKARWQLRLRHGGKGAEQANERADKNRGERKSQAQSQPVKEVVEVGFDHSKLEGVSHGSRVLSLARLTQFFGEAHLWFRRLHAKPHLK